jgi:uncharacterized membrane protein YeaQ/YmgE (transglycosylase-associated protein family)
MCDLLGWLIVGGFIGWLASIITGRNQRQGCLMNVVVGVVGAAIGGLGYNLVTGRGLAFSFGSFDITSIGGVVVALIGAVGLLLVLNIIQRR